MWGGMDSWCYDRVQSAGLIVGVGFRGESPWWEREHQWSIDICQGACLHGKEMRWRACVKVLVKRGMGGGDGHGVSKDGKVLVSKN